MLDTEYGTCTNPTVGGICTGLNIAPIKVGGVIGVVKAYTTRIGSGPFPTEVFDYELCGHLTSLGHEYVTITGRHSHCGWLDIVALKYSCVINDFVSLNLTKLEVLSQLPEIKIGVAYTLDGTLLESFPSNLCDLQKMKVEYESLAGWNCNISSSRNYSDLPEAARFYMERIDELVDVPIHYIGVGPERDAIVFK